MASKRVSENKVILSGGAAVPTRRKSATKRVSRPADIEIASTPASELSEPEVLSAESAVPVGASAASAESLQEAVARLAYSYWEARGYQGGSPEADWLRAEQELSAR